MSLNFMNCQDIFFPAVELVIKKSTLTQIRNFSYRKESLEKSISNYLILLLTTCYQNDSMISIVDITFSSRKESTNFTAFQFSL